MVTYEWTVEIMDCDDVIDTHGYDSYRQALESALEDRAAGKVAVIVLVRHTWNNVDGDLDDRQWAYFEDGDMGGTLPAAFDGGARMLPRFAAEVKAAAR